MRVACALNRGRDSIKIRNPLINVNTTSNKSVKRRSAAVRIKSPPSSERRRRAKKTTSPRRTDIILNTRFHFERPCAVSLSTRAPPYPPVPGHTRSACDICRYTRFLSYASIFRYADSAAREKTMRTSHFWATNYSVCPTVAVCATSYFIYMYVCTRKHTNKR